MHTKKSVLQYTHHNYQEDTNSKNSNQILQTR